LKEYYDSIPNVIEFGSERRLDAAALRELRKRLDRTDTEADEVKSVADECMEEIVELSSGKLSNTITNVASILLNYDR
jgi:hypothetical protein